jgi:hypothetical protein
VYHYFYLFINIGAVVGQRGMVYCKEYVSFWLLFTLPTIMLCICPLALLWGRKRYRRVHPQGSRSWARPSSCSCWLIWGRRSLNPVGTYKRLRDRHHASRNLADGETRCANIDVNVWAKSGSYILIMSPRSSRPSRASSTRTQRRPLNMLSMVQAVALFMNTVSSAIGFALVSLAEVCLPLPLPGPTVTSRTVRYSKAGP